MASRTATTSGLRGDVGLGWECSKQTVMKMARDVLIVIIKLLNTINLGNFGHRNSKLWSEMWGGGPGVVGLSVDSTTFLQIFYSQQKNSKSTILHDFLKKIVDSTIITKIIYNLHFF